MLGQRHRSYVISAVIVTLILVAQPCISSAASERVIHSFVDCSEDACSPLAAPMFDGVGHLYGTAGGGGEYVGAGTVYALTRTRDGWSEGVIYTFDVHDGAGPAAPLIADNYGNLYGTTTGGGAHDWGVVFQLTPESEGWSETVLYSFCSEGGGYCTDGQNPWAGVVMDKSGDLFGLTRQGGYKGVCGVAFELTPNGDDWTEQVIHTFERKPPNDACEPYFSPVLDAGEKHLFGSSYYGGPDDYGTVFEISPTMNGKWNERVVLSLQGAKDGSHPYGGLVFDRAGNLYGTASEYGPTGQGTVFKLSPAAHGQWRETILYTFPKIENGGYPLGTLAIDRKGALYGIAGGGNNCSGDACGVTYKLAPQAHGKWKYTVVYKFNGSDGMWPQGGVILDKQQKHLYGTTEYGGAYGYGVVFQITL